MSVEREVDRSDPSVLSYLRQQPGQAMAVLVAMNFTDQPHTVSYDLQDKGIKSSTAHALLEDHGIGKTVNLRHLTLPPFAVFIGQVQ